MLTGTDGTDVVANGNPHHVLKGGKGVLPVDSGGLPWTGDYVFSSGDLVEDLTHNHLLETGARNGKLKVYEMVDHFVARALTGYLLVRGGVHQIANRGGPAPDAVPLHARRRQGGRRGVQGPAPRDGRGPRRRRRRAAVTRACRA